MEVVVVVAQGSRLLQCMYWLLSLESDLASCGSGLYSSCSPLGCLNALKTGEGLQIVVPDPV